MSLGVAVSGEGRRKGCEAPDVTNVVLLGMGAQAPHEHVLLHALAKRRDRCNGRQGIHGEFLSLKELHGRIAGSTRSRLMNTEPSQNQAILPRSGFVHEARSGHSPLSAFGRQRTGSFEEQILKSGP